MVVLERDRRYISIGASFGRCTRPVVESMRLETCLRANQLGNSSEGVGCVLSCVLHGKDLAAFFQV